MTEPSLKLPDDPDPEFTRPGDARSPLSFDSLVRLAAAVALVVATSLIGQIGTMRGLGPWYSGLIKPSFTPPNVAFPIAWSILFALMAWAFWRVLRLGGDRPGRAAAIRLFCLQLALNALWSWAFFGFRNPLAGLAVILALEAMIVLTIAAFRKVDGFAAALLWPYAAWVGYATLINAAVFWLNR